jgi:hypothetical protein
VVFKFGTATLVCPARDAIIVEGDIVSECATVDRFDTSENI